MTENKSFDETMDDRFATENNSVWPTSLLADMLEARQKSAERRLRAAIGPLARELWSKAVIEYSYAIAADRSGNDDHCKLYSQKAILLEARAMQWDTDHGA